MKSIYVFGFFVALVLTMSACNNAAVTLTGTKWELATLNGNVPLPDVTVTMNFDPGGQLSGTDGCNHYSGTYSVNGSQLKLNQGASTMMACEESIMAQANSFSTALANTQTYVTQKDTLIVRDATGKELATFTPFKPTSLQETLWVALSINNGKQGVVNAQEDAKITAEFKKDGTLSGSSGCNTYHTTYKTDGDKITIQPAATTRMACSQPIMDQEQQYLNALTKSATFEMGKGTLELRDGDGSLQVMYQSAEQ
jgi:heat shock protein HslJ